MVALPLSATKRTKWDSDILLGGLAPSDLRVMPGSVDSYRAIIWNDLCSEYDALFFYHEIQRLAFPLSDDLIAILPEWKRDEDNHFRGLKRLYPLIYGGSPEEVQEIVATRQPD